MKNSQTTLSGSTKPKDRIAAIDQFRGFAILLMILADYLNNIRTIPAWRTYNHFFSRNLALIGLGFLITLGECCQRTIHPLRIGGCCRRWEPLA